MYEIALGVGAAVVVGLGFLIGVAIYDRLMSRRPPTEPPQVNYLDEVWSDFYSTVTGGSEVKS